MARVPESSELVSFPDVQVLSRDETTFGYRLYINRAFQLCQ